MWPHMQLHAQLNSKKTPQQTQNTNGYKRGRKSLRMIPSPMRARARGLAGSHLHEIQGHALSPKNRARVTANRPKLLHF